GEPSLHDPELLMEFDTSVEVKNVSFSSFNSWNGEIPPYYYVQKQSQLASTGAPYGYFVALVDNSDLHIWKVDADPEWQDYINLQTVDLSLRIGRAKDIQDQLVKDLSEEQRELLLTEFYELEPIAGAEENTTDMLKNMYSS